jgi:hypothetical protein
LSELIEREPTLTNGLSRAGQPFLGTKEEQKAGGDMDFFERLSVAEYRSLAARWRRLATDATTAQTRTHLLTRARQCEFLAGKLGTVTAEIVPVENGAALPDTPQ